ncbi:MAG TPA: cupin domain-containing protein [Candidatus Limnocylindrales bacterium]|nr:cupin domain-containing protein [Candidatus Limnocylindrales bacterium]
MVGDQQAQLIRIDDVPAVEQDGCRIQWLIDQSRGAAHVMAYRAQVGQGRGFSHAHPDADEVLYVIAGRGVFTADGVSRDVQPGMALFAPRGCLHALTGQGPGMLEVVGAMAPPIDVRNGTKAGASRGAEGAGPLTIAERSVAPTMMSETAVAPTLMGERSFRLLVNPEVGCASMTQFTGIIPPGRAPLHAHPYEEATYILAGRGRLWIEDAPVGELHPGTIAFLPIGVRHTLENTAEDSLLKVLGAFSPANSPEAKLPTAR